MGFRTFATPGRPITQVLGINDRGQIVDADETANAESRLNCPRRPPDQATSHQAPAVWFHEPIEAPGRPGTSPCVR
jgi:hypothetical protein